MEDAQLLDIISSTNKKIDDKIVAIKEQERIELEQAEKRRQEAAALAEEERKRKAAAIAKAKKIAKRIFVLTLIAIALYIVCAIVNNSVLEPNKRYNKALALIEEQNYEQGYSILEELGGFRDSKTQILKSKYDRAIAYANSGNYSSALSLLEETDNYKDSKLKIQEITETANNELYVKSIDLMDNKKYDEAISILIELGDYKDSKQKLSSAYAEQKEYKYNTAVSFLNNGQLDNAITIFTELGSYKDATDLITTAKTRKIKTANIGSSVMFGNYEQDNDTANGKEEIEWIVIGKENNKVLLISKYALDCRNYSSRDVNGNYYVERYGVTWEKSDLREWLNNEFFAAAFSSSESKLISSTLLTNNNSPIDGTRAGPNTTDRVFVLSTKEADKYLLSDSLSATRATEYAIAKGAYKNTSTAAYNKNTRYWLRTPGQTWDNTYSISAIFMDVSGSYGSGIATSTAGVTNRMAVRPAICIDVNNIK